jgi:hypothetical protein
MTQRRACFILEIVSLWLIFAALTIITWIAFVASSTRADCSTANITLASNELCTPQEHLSATVHHYATYFQGTHIIIIRAIAALSLLVFKPSLWAMTRSSLESSALSSTGIEGLKMKMSTFQSSVDLVNSPTLISSVLHAKGSGSLTPQVSFVLVISLLSLLCPIAVSPIYRPHTGPFYASAAIMNGGGVGPSISSTFNGFDLVPGGIASGRALINAGTIMNTSASVHPPIFDISVAPFIPRLSVQAIWYTQVKTVVARNGLDCGSTAPARLSNNSRDLVTLDDAYFAPNLSPTNSIPSFVGRTHGYISNDPALTTIYLNSTLKVAPGVVEAQTSVIFLAANGTLEGAQHRITSPESTSKIKFVDVLVCTSTTRLEVSMCTIDKGSVRSCDFIQPTNVSSSTTGGVEIYITNPDAVAITLSASPVTAYYVLGNRLPMLGINQWYIDSGTPPLSFLTFNTANTPYNIPLTYITDVLFASTAQGLVQGMITAWPTYANQSVTFISVFGASAPLLLLVIIVVSLLSALIATVSSTLPRSARRATELDVSRLLAISRNPQLDAMLQEYSDLNVKMEEDISRARVGYGWVDGLNRCALMMAYEEAEQGSQTYGEVELDSLSVGLVYNDRDGAERKSLFHK